MAYRVLGVRYSGRSIFFTTASMIVLVNSVVAAAIITSVCTLGAGLAATGAVVMGVVAALGALKLGLFYESRRLAPLIDGDPADGGGGDLA